MKNIIRYSDNLFLIALKQNLTGFDSFIGSWVITGEKTILVDPGTSYSVPVLVKSLKELGVKKIDAILLTHIHIDHAGGTGNLLKHFPGTPVVVHKSGIKHMINPEKLWQGSLATLGHFAEAYGPILPVPGELLIDSDTFTDFGIQPVNTPGHAPHHVSYLFEDIMFAGEVAGVFSDMGKGYYLRPATPPRFFLKTSIDSLMLADEIEHSTVCFAHFGMTSRRDEIYKRSRDQLLTWAELIEGQMGSCDEPDFIERTTEILLKNDPALALFARLDKDSMVRERGFMKNSINGYAGYFKDKKSE